MMSVTVNNDTADGIGSNGASTLQVNCNDDVEDDDDESSGQTEVLVEGRVLARLGDQCDVTSTWCVDAVSRFVALRAAAPQKALQWYVQAVRENGADAMCPEACRVVDGVADPYRLYPYQAFALRFALHRETHPYYGIRGGILNLFPGLGKTLWLLTLVWTTWRSEAVAQRPTLVVVPSSVVYEWRANIVKFFGDRLPFAIMARGWSANAKSVDEATVAALARYPLVITTYSVLRSAFSRRSDAADECILRADDGKVMGLRRAAPAPSSAARGTACLFRVPWARVAYDESQTACNVARVTFQACYAVPAPLRWCLTGMPLRNSSLDLFAQLLMVGLRTTTRTSMTRAGTFYAVHKGLWTTDTFAESRLQRTMLTVVYKDTHLRMPPLRTVLHVVKMRPEERRVYAVFADQARREFRRYEAGAASLVHVLTRVTRLRQASDCAYLLHVSDAKKRLRRATATMRARTAATTGRVQSVRRDGSSDADADRVVTIDDILNENDDDDADSCDDTSRVPPLGETGGASHARSGGGGGGGGDAVDACDPAATHGENVLDAVRDALGDDMVAWCGCWEGTAGRHASKVRAIVDLIDRIADGRRPVGDGDATSASASTSTCVPADASSVTGATAPVKVIVYSAFSEMLRCLSRVMHDRPHCVMTGENSADERTATLDQFRLSRTHNVLLMTYKVGSLGLTLVEATHAIFTEPWFCYSVHLQALYRLYRIGQERAVHVHWMVSDFDNVGHDRDDIGMIEWRVLQIASEKIQMTNELLAQDLVADVPQFILSYMGATANDDDDDDDNNGRARTSGTSYVSLSSGRALDKKRKRSGDTAATTIDGLSSRSTRGETVSALRSFLFPAPASAGHAAAASAVHSQTGGRRASSD